MHNLQTLQVSRLQNGFYFEKISIKVSVVGGILAHCAIYFSLKLPYFGQDITKWNSSSIKNSPCFSQYLHTLNSMSILLCLLTSISNLWAKQSSLDKGCLNLGISTQYRYSSYSSKVLNSVYVVCVPRSFELLFQTYISISKMRLITWFKNTTTFPISWEIQVAPKLKENIKF